ncbi:MAG: hypothetical protein MJ211_14110 [Bacteroidales bacterium]|nr:hypothetical protein [Bacteroidales bacterium]
MKKKLLLILLLLPIIGKSQAPFQSRPTALTINQKTFEFSLFSQSRYGFAKNTEVYSSVLEDWLLPNIGIKRLWYTKPAKKETGFFASRNIYFGSLHTFDYPKMFFDFPTIQKRGDISDTCITPSVITMKNEIRATIFLKNKTSCSEGDFLLTLRAGLKNSFKLNKNANMPPITKPLWYRESVVCLDTIVWFVGADLDIHITDRINLLVDADFYSVDWNVKDWSGENKIFAYGYLYERRILVQAGVKFLYGTINKDFDSNLLPMIDFSYFFKPKKRQTGLWGNMKI